MLINSPSGKQEPTEIAGYNQQRLDKFCFGGVVSIYARETIRFLIRNDSPSENLEMLYVEAQPSNCRPFLLFVATDPQTLQLVFLPRQRRFFHILTGSQRDNTSGCHQL